MGVWKTASTSNSSAPAPDKPFRTTEDFYKYPDFTELVGKFLDLLAAGAFAEARVLPPAACAAWLATRRDSPLTGWFVVWDTTLTISGN